MLENLNDYKEAYKHSFKFHDENQWFLSYYARIMSEIIRSHKYESALSLGMGFKIVSDQIINELSFNLKSYAILEGAENIIEEFKKEYYNDKRITPIHTYFENFVTEDKYDVIEMGFILEHVDDPEFILSHYKKYLKKGGRIFIAVPNARSLHRLIGYEAGLLDNLYKLSAYDLELGHKRYFDLESLSSLVLKTGYKIQKTIGLMLKPITGNQIKELGWDESIIGALFKIGESYPEIANCILIEATI